jgi:cullin 4
MGHELRSDISHLISHLITHEKYASVFESFYVDMTESYYSEESRRISIAMKSDPAEFMIHCIGRVQDETQRSKDILLESSWELVRSTTERSLLQNQLSWVAMQGRSRSA